jgi:hypothetical protein
VPFWYPFQRILVRGAAIAFDAEAIHAGTSAQLWEQLFPSEQARIIQLLVRRVTVMADGLVIDLRTDGIAGVMRDLMTPRQLKAAQ